MIMRSEKKRMRHLVGEEQAVIKSLNKINVKS